MIGDEFKDYKKEFDDATGDVDTSEGQSMPPPTEFHVLAEEAKRMGASRRGHSWQVKAQQRLARMKNFIKEKEARHKKGVAFGNKNDLRIAEETKKLNKFVGRTPSTDSGR